MDLCNPSGLEQKLRERQLYRMGVRVQEVSVSFKDFYDSFISKISPVLSQQGEKESVEASVAVFVSSPNCIVPYPSDPENNFLFQLIENKEFYVFSNADFELFSAIN